MKPIASLLIATGLTLVGQRSIAQVIPDNTVGTTVSGSNLIEGGTRVGNNLFHSFSQFSIPTGSNAIFNNSVDIQTIFSRVTGNTRSSIDGLIEANGTTNLFLMNPNGIVFGPNAKLDIGGSFIGTTATSIKFADGVQFSASDLSSNSLLTVSLPIGLQMGINPGIIQVNGLGHKLIIPNVPSPIIGAGSSVSGLRVSTGKTLALVGGQISLDGGILTAPSGQIELGAVNGIIPLIPNVNGWTFDYAGIANLGDINLTRKALVDVSGPGGGNAQLGSRNLTFQGNSAVLSLNKGLTPAGTLRLRATEKINIIGDTLNSTFRSGVLTETIAGPGANIIVEANQLSLEKTGLISTNTFSFAKGGDLTVNASSIQLNGIDDASRLIRTNIRSTNYGTGNAGNINLNTDRLSVINGGILTSTVYGPGLGGNLTVNAKDFVEIVGQSSNRQQQFSLISPATFGVGNAGQVIINTERFFSAEGGFLSTSTLASGNAGNIIINASKSVDLVGLRTSGVSANVSSSGVVAPIALQKSLGLPPFPSGAAGNVTINTPQLTLKEYAVVSVANGGTGNAGTIFINAQNIKLDGNGRIDASTKSGSGGNISINSQFLQMRRQSGISATAGGVGNGGNISINSPIILGIENSDIVANAVRGSGGNIQITTQELIGLKYRSQLTPENDITASSEFGISGSVQVNSLGLDPGIGLVKLNGEVIDSSRSISKGCSENQGNSFISTGRGGIPQNPIKKIMTDRPWNDMRSLSASQSTTSIPIAEIQNPKSKIVEATQIQTLADGSIALINPSPINPSNSQTCAIAP